MSKKSVSVAGKFYEGMKIDATFVANKSWLRALLWAFVFALREQVIFEKGHNEFPLMLLDDPQTTFDPKNLKQWTSKIVEIANYNVTDSKGMQLILTTHDRQFYDEICNTNSINGQYGEIIGPTCTEKVACIVNGTALQRQFELATKDNNGKEGYQYIRDLRVHLESLFRIMLRGEDPNVLNDGLGKLQDILSTLITNRVAPFNRPVFVRIIKYMKNNSCPERKKIWKWINDTHHHKFDDTIGFAEAMKVNDYWKKTLEPDFKKAFRCVADYNAYGGMARLVDWQEQVIPFPEGNKDQVKTLKFCRTGIVAVAESEGIGVGDGQISIQEANNEQPITLYNHSVYRLNAGTINPVADIGDVILVQNYKQPVSRNLVVGVYGDKLYARRLHETKDDSDLVVLTGQATDPYRIPEPVIAPKDKIDLRKIIGTVFLPSAVPPPVNGHEVTEIDSFGFVKDRLKNVKLLQVKGRSMEPIALEEQYLITKAENPDLASVKKLDGQLVIAEDEGNQIYFKRLRLHKDFVVLESTNSHRSTSSAILSLKGGSEFPKLTSLRSVVGVIFDLPS